MRIDRGLMADTKAARDGLPLRQIGDPHTHHTGGAKPELKCQRSAANRNQTQNPSRDCNKGQVDYSCRKPASQEKENRGASNIPKS